MSPRGTLPPADAAALKELEPPRVLLIDDDDMLRRVLVRTLKRKYAVTEARDAESALTLLEGGEKFDAILCDLNLLGLSGRQFLMHLDAYDPVHADRTIILSGSPRDSMDEEFLDVIDIRFVEKPASASSIESMISHVVIGHARAA